MSESVKVPKGFDGITPEWLTAAYSVKYPGVVVESVQISDKDFGSSAKAKLELTFNEAGVAAGLATSTIAKTGYTEFAFDDSILTVWDELISHLNRSEARFYGEFAEDIELNKPAAYIALQGEGPRNTFILLNDLRVEGCRFSTYDKPLTGDEMAGFLTQLARLHASKWESPELPGYKLMDSFIDGGIAEAMITQTNWDEQMARPRGQLVPPELQDRRDLCAAGVEAVVRLKHETPGCLLHGDPHVGNMYFTADGEPGFYDWQLFCNGKWAWDVGYSMAGAMEIEDRRKHEVDLLRHYLDELASAGAPAPGFDEAWFDYRRFAAWGILALMTPGGDFQTEGYNSTVGQRQATAIVDLESYQALGLL